MDKKSPFLRRLPKRSLTLLYVLSATVAAFVLASLYFERDETSTSLTPTSQPENMSSSAVHVVKSWANINAEYSFKTEADSDFNVDAISKVNVDAGSSYGRSNAVYSVNVNVNADNNTSTESSGNVAIANDRFNVDSNVIKVKADVATKTYKSTPRRKKTFINNTKYIYLTPNVTTSTTTQRTLIKGSTCSSDVEKDSKLILLWTSFFGYWSYMPQERFDRCEGCSNCRVTRDKSLLFQADAVVFHCRDMSLSHIPAVRNPKQVWLFYCLESPVYSDFPGLQHMRGMFNWTVTYRRDSNVVARYGSVTKVRPPRQLDIPHLRSVFLNKRRSVAFLSSHCPTYGGRDAYVAELRKHIDVDAYGDCGNYVCPMTSKDFCHGEFEQNYKFLLAFENAVCQDYVTEKFYRTLSFDIVPVVFGGGPYEGLAPPGSFIDALKFKSPRHLAFFLKGVGEDFDRYVSYFKWRKDYTVDLSNTKECDTCRMLHDKKRKRASYVDLRKWWVDGSQCRTWGV